jgi:hypothetical protein
MDEQGKEGSTRAMISNHRRKGAVFEGEGRGSETGRVELSSDRMTMRMTGPCSRVLEAEAWYGRAICGGGISNRCFIIQIRGWR